MPNTIAVSFVDEYNDNLMLLSQQMRSKFRGSFMEDTHVGDGASAVDQLGTVEAEQRTTRHGVIAIHDVPHDRRWVYPEDWDTGDIIDKEDRLRMNIAPDGKYTKVFNAAMNRALDVNMIASFFADAKTGVKGGTTTSALGSTNVIAVGVGAAADTGLNTDKLLAARETILSHDIDIDDPDNRMYCAINANYEHQLLEQIKIINSDYTPALPGKGFLGEWKGITFIHSEKLLTDSNDDVRVPFWCKSGMHLGIWKDIFGDIYELPNYKRKPTYISAGATFGSTRIEEKKVVEIICDPT